MFNLSGCQVLNSTDNKTCLQCNQQSTLSNGTCNCFFNYTLTIAPHQEIDSQAPENSSSNTATNNSKATYDYLIDNFLVFNESIPKGEFFNCSDLFEIKFYNNVTAKNQTQSFFQRANATQMFLILDLTNEFQTLQCQVALFFYFRYDPYAFTNELRILNLSTSLNDAFNSGLVQFHIKKDSLEFDCKGKEIDYAIKVNGSWNQNLTEEAQAYLDIPGCLIYLESFPRQCGLCQPYAFAAGRQCLCQFRFNVSLEDDLNSIVIRHFLNISESLLFNNRTLNKIFNCSDYISFTYSELGLNYTLQPDQDALQCIFEKKVVNESQIPENDTSVHYTSILTINNASDLFIQAFSFGLINITFNQNISNQACVGDVNYTVNYAESECGNQTCFGEWGLLDVFNEGTSFDNLNDEIDILFPHFVDLFGNLTDLIKTTEAMMTNQNHSASNQQNVLDQPRGGSRLLQEQDQLLGSEYTSCSEGCFACNKKTYSCSMCQIGWVRKYENGRFICYNNPCVSMMKVKIGNRTWGDQTRVYDPKTRKCVTCPDGCSNCTTQGECTECKDGYFEFRTQSKSLQCYEACPTDTYSDFDNQRCTICDPKCSQCKKDPSYVCGNKNNYGTCSKSNNGKWEISCKKTCGKGYRASNGWCHKCPDYCEECSSDDQCTKCSSGHTLAQGSCSQQVCTDSHEYYDQNGQCSSCNEECMTCSMSANNCTSCPTDYYLEPTSGKCINQPSGGGGPQNIFCIIGYGYDSQKRQCVKCPDGCKTCGNSQDCTSCDSNYVLFMNDTTQMSSCLYLKCPDGYYYNNTLDSCQACGEGCQKCTGLNQCNICSADWYRGRYGCFMNCSENQYLDKDSSKYYKCSNCPQNCSKCSQFGSCEECEPGYVRVMSRNASQAPDPIIQKIIGKYCIARPGNCPNGTYYNSSYDSCVSCQEGCAKCDNDGVCHQNCTPMKNCNACSIKPELCVECSNGYYQHWDKNLGYTCSPQIQTCNQSDQYYDNRSNQCEECSQNCQNCVNDTYCTTCDQGYYKILLPTINRYNESMLSTQCVSNCSDYSGYFVNSKSKVCLQCSRNCLQCSSKSQCKVCDEYTVLLKGQCACQNRQRVKLYPSKYQAEIDIYNLKWLPSYSYIFNGAPFYCKDIFNLEEQESQDNATMVNATEYSQFDYLTCLASYKQDEESKNYVRIDMYNITKDLQDAIRTQQVALILDPEVYDQQCISAWEVYQIFFPKAQYVNNTLQDMQGRILEAGTEDADLGILDKEMQNDQLLYFRDEKSSQFSIDLEENNKQDSYISITVIIASFLLTAVLVSVMIYNCSQNRKPRRRVLFEIDDIDDNYNNVEMQQQQSKTYASVQVVYNQNPEEIDGQ